jgi:hypothetical protein
MERRLRDMSKGCIWRRELLDAGHSLPADRVAVQGAKTLASNVGQADNNSGRWLCGVAACGAGSGSLICVGLLSSFSIRKMVGNGTGRASGMGDIFVAGLVLALVLASSALGMFLEGRLHETHRRRETTDAIRLIMAIVVTFTALVLGLVTSSVKSSHDLFDARLRGFASDIIELDLRLKEYGETAGAMRAILRTYVAAAIADTWRDEPRPPGVYPTFPPTQSYEREQLGAMLFELDNAIRRLEPPDDFHRKLAESIATRMTDMLQQRWLLIVTPQDTVSSTLIILMVFWLVMIFGVFGLTSPRNRVVYAALLMCAVSISSAIYLILDLDKPLSGLITVSSAPMRNALRHIDSPP